MVEDPHDDGVVTRRLGHAQGLVSEGLAAFKWAPEGEFRTQGREYERPIRAVRRKPIDGQLQDCDLVGVDGTGANTRPVVGQGGGHKAFGVTQVGRPARSAEEGVAKSGVPGLALGGAQPDRQVDAQNRSGSVAWG